MHVQTITEAPATPLPNTEQADPNIKATHIRPITMKAKASGSKHFFVCNRIRIQSVRAEMRSANARSRGKRFTFQSTVRQLERRRLAEKLSKEADLKEQQRRTELEAMRRVEEEFQRKRAREKANIRQQLRLVSSGAASMPITTHHGNKARDEPDGSCRASPAPERPRDRQRHSNASSEISARSKSTTPVRCVELSEWRTESAARVYRDWGGAAAALPAHAHPPACARMPIAHAAQETEAFSGSPRSDNYRLEFARGRSPRSPRTPRPPRLLSATRSPSTSGSELSLRQPIKIRLNHKASFTFTVAFDDALISSGPCLLQSSTSSRQCLACAHKAKLRNGTAPTELRLDPAVLKPEPEKIEIETLKGISDKKPAVFEAGCQTERWSDSPAILELGPSGKLTDMAVVKPDSGVREALEDRDPNSLNQHVQIVWDDIIGEPEGARSPECAWRVSNVCFKHARNWCYTVLAVLIAPPCALLLGCGFACLAFEHARNWCYTVLAVLIAPPCALLLGCGFACLAFEHARNWCYTVLAVLIAPPCALLLGCGFACLAFEVSSLTQPSASSTLVTGVTPHVCFKHARNWCYTVLAVLIAPPCALLLGCGFACLAFEQIWCTAPCLRCVKIYFASLRTMVQSCMAATVVPTAEAVGHVCRHIRVNFRRDAADERDMLVV
ncbi:hypothetical protein MSG28_010599 [Choristoneura fumiferana]|uniref:Uncharacterized protein n=1 Tax=Choristoneura fumiferana TaxID=7141 RepID=A0ACC0KNH7_CHOFU|nr:hypothetical protein MSG28_010599 [Choristoneura fumiferana]